MKEYNDQGIILDVIRFKENDQILTVFTEKSGVIKLIAKKKAASGRGLSPLSLGEFRYSPSRVELHRAQEIHIQDTYLGLRSSLERLTAAGRMVKAVAKSQMVGKPAPKLYQLLVCYLENLSQGGQPELFCSSFLLKMFKHEGVWPPPFQCHSCYKALEGASFYGFEPFCKEHAPPGALFFSREEVAVMAVLTESKSLEALKSLTITEALAQKIGQLFDISFRKAVAIN